MSKQYFLNFKDNFDSILQQEWAITISAYGEDKYNQLISLFDTELDENGNKDGKLSNTEAQNLFKMAEAAAREMGDPTVLETEEADKLVLKLGINITGEELIRFMAKLKGNVCWALAGGITRPKEPHVKITRAEQIQPGNGISPEEKYTLKNLQKLYPKNKYEIEEDQYGNDKIYKIIDKYSRKEVAGYLLSEDGTARINLNNMNGEWIVSYEETSYGVISAQWTMQEDGEWDYKKYPNGDPEAENIVSNLRQSGCGTQGLKDVPQFFSSIKSITPSNVINTIDIFGGKTPDKEGNRTLLFDWIAACDTLSPEGKKTVITYIIKQLLTVAKQKGIYINDLEVKLNSEIYSQLDSGDWRDAKYVGLFAQQLMNRIESGGPDSYENLPNGIVVDEDFRQGRTGDCWLLASIKGIANTPKGREILNNSIKVNDDGSVDVTLKGVNKTYHITRAELEGNTQLSRGDGDVRALEIAVEKFFEEERGSERTGNSLDINGNHMYIAMQILTGADANRNNIPLAESKLEKFVRETPFLRDLLSLDSKAPRDAVLASFNKPNLISGVSAHGDKKDLTCDATPFGTGKLTTNHAYTVSRYDGENVYLINPWDSSTELIVDKKTFFEFFDNLEYSQL